MFILTLLFVNSLYFYFHLLLSFHSSNDAHYYFLSKVLKVEVISLLKTEGKKNARKL